jgi:hypothetical protein
MFWNKKTEKGSLAMQSNILWFQPKWTLHKNKLENDI